MSTPEDRVRVVIADDHAHVRGRIREALEAGGCEVCAEAATAFDAVTLSREHRPDVALLDIHMPGDGINAARQISQESPETTVIMLTQSREDDDLFDALRAGAAGYLLKDTDPRELATALRGALRGEVAMPTNLVARIIKEFQGPSRRLPVRRSRAAERLTPRELEVMELLGRGRTTDEVARTLFISPTTVRVHVSAVLRKLRVKDRDSAFRLIRDDRETRRSPD